VATPKTVIWTPDPHTKAKHQILSGYLDAYFPIVTKQFSDAGVAFIDAFSGPGEYEDGSDGSPIIALESARASVGGNSTTPLKFIFIEKERDRFDHLADLLTQRTLPATTTIESRHGHCADVLTPLIDELEITNWPMFVNCDGWGVDTPYTLIEAVSRTKRPEVMVTISTQWFMRFADTTEGAAGDKVFGDASWRQVANVPTTEKKRWLVERYRRRLADAGFEFQLTFELVDEMGHPLFLIFGTHSVHGVEKMKDSMWRVDSSSGSRFRDPRDPNQTAFDLSDSEPTLEVLEGQILEHLGRSGVQSLKNLQEFALRETIFKKTHAVKAVTRLETLNKVTAQHAKAYKNYMVTLADPSLF